MDVVCVLSSKSTVLCDASTTTHLACTDPTPTHTQGDTAARARLLCLLCPVYPQGLMWRNAKSDVAHDLDIPPQHALLTSLTFNAIERHWYQRQHQVVWGGEGGVMVVRGWCDGCEGVVWLWGDGVMRRVCVQLLLHLI